MRTIIKNPSHRGYKPLAGRVPPSTSEQATADWGNFNSRRSVLNALLAEQYHLCCYSEIRADEEDLGYHIEHIENKSQRPERTFDPSNLAASGVDVDGGFRKFKQEAKGLDINRFGGHAPPKTQNVDMTRFIHPYLAGCSAHFKYLSDGRVIPNPVSDNTAQQRADYTINLLNLNSPYLIQQRRNWWQELLNVWNDQPEKYTTQAQCDLVPVDGKLSRFFSLTRQFWGPIAEMTLAEHAPELT
jgi:uncharacterized protein (TIGR02646 family)